MKVGDKATWDGKACEVVGHGTGDYWLRVRWQSGTRNGKPRNRYASVSPSWLTPIATPAPSVEATAVGKRGAWKRRQDVTEAAARVPCPHEYMRDGKPACDGTPRCPEGFALVDGTTFCTIPAPKPADAKPADPICHVHKTPISECAKAGRVAQMRCKWTERTADLIDAAEAKPADPDALPVGWQWKPHDPAYVPIAQKDGCEVWRTTDGQHYYSMHNGRPNHASSRAEAIAACEAWIAANAKPAETACAGCAEKDATIGRMERTINGYAASVTAFFNRESATVQVLNEAKAHNRPGDTIADRVRDVCRLRDEWKAKCADAATLRDIACTNLARQTDEGNRAHDLLAAAGVPFAPSLVERIGVLLKVLTDRTLDVERLERERDAAVKDELEATQQAHDLAVELTDTEAKIKHWREVAKYNADGYCTEAKRADGWRWSAWVCGGLAVAGWATALWLVLPA